MSAQDFEWGKISQEEIELKRVPFEAGADAVILKEFGNLTLTNNGYELEEHIRIKILSENGFSFALKKWRYDSNDNFDKTTVTKAQTTNIENGKIVITDIENKDILIHKTEKGIVDVVLAFPNVSVGSIIEYKLLIIKPYNLLSSPWFFQDELPIISSKLKLKSLALSNYKIILKGNFLMEKYAKSSQKRHWELENIPSYNIYKHIYNVDDYRENLIIQRNNYELEPFGNSWKDFKKFLTKDFKISIKDVDFKEIANQIPNGNSQLETLKNCLDYINNNYHTNGRMSAIGEYLKDGLLKTKTGNSAEFNLLLNGILKEKNITSKLAVNSLRYNGKIIVSHPVFSKLQALVNIVTIDNNENLMIDAAVSTSKNIKYLSKNYFNFIALDLESKKEDNFIIVSPNLSEFISRQELEIKKDSMVLKIRDQYKGYFDETSFFPVFSGAKISETERKELEEWTIKRKNISVDNPNLSFLVIENPFTKTIRDLSVDANRNYPIELDFPYLSSVELKANLPEHFNLETDNFNQEISAFDDNLQFVQKAEVRDNEATITWSLFINKSIFQVSEIKEYNYFISQCLTMINKAVVIKN